MTHLKIKKSKANIYKYPQKEATNATQLSIGDLHANAMFLMHFLVTNGVVTISEEHYEQLKEIYCNIFLTQMDIQEFNNIIDKLEISNKPVLRFIGDEVCDRGQNDYFMFKIFDKLKKSGVACEILLSNHGIEFLIPYEKKEKLDAPHIGFNGQSRSMDNMRKLIEDGVLTQEEVDVLITESYLPSLKLISYSLQNKNITLYSHAPIGLETIQALAEKFKDDGVIYKDDTAEDLAQTIDAINQVFSKHVQAGTAHILAEKFDTKHLNFKTDPVTFLIWNRSYGTLQRPQEYKGYQMYFAHGHDLSERTWNNIFNLDNIYFKGVRNHIGSYEVLGYRHNGSVAVLKKSEFNSALSKLEAKIKTLRNQGDEEAYQSALTIHSTLTQAYKDLQKNRNFEESNKTCTANMAQNKSLFFVHKTESGKIVDEIQEKLDSSCRSFNAQ